MSCCRAPSEMDQSKSEMATRVLSIVDRVSRIVSRMSAIIARIMESVFMCGQEWSIAGSRS